MSIETPIPYLLSSIDFAIFSACFDDAKDVDQLDIDLYW